MENREKVISKLKKVVIKVGTRLLTDESRIPVLVQNIAEIRAKGIDVLLVSSGAVGVGMKQLQMTSRPKKLAEVQALASVGQGRLLQIYSDECRKYGFHAAQVLLTANDLRERERHLNVLNCLNSLCSKNILPIINENDVVSVDELKFGDNDFLAALVATMTQADMTIILTTESGLRHKENGKLTDRISEVYEITDELKMSASGTDNSDFSIGGMISKLKAAEIVCPSGEYLWIADGRDDNTLKKILNAEDIGTLFLPTSKNHMQGRKRWIRFFSPKRGRIVVDEGAVKALLEDGKSLLPSGIAFVEGSFQRGDTVEICDRFSKPLGRGLVNFTSKECEKIAGCQMSEIPEILQQCSDSVIIHRDNMVIDKAVVN